jgi:hypothetical protein
MASLCDRFFLQSRRSVYHEAADSYANFSRIAVRSSGTLGKGRKLRLTVDGGFLSRLFLFAFLIQLLLNNASAVWQAKKINH